MTDLVIMLLDKFVGAFVTLPVLLIYFLICDRERAKQRWPWLCLLVIYLSAMYIVVGVPDIRYIRWDPRVNLMPFQDLQPSNLLGMALNAVMFLPLGFLLPAYFERYRGWGRTLAAGFLTSAMVEGMQLFAARASDVDDLIMNTLGVLIGFILSKIILRHRTAVYRGKMDWLDLLVINIVILLVTVFARYPLMEAALKLLNL